MKQAAMDQQGESPEKQKTIIIEKTLNLPLETVWKAWTEPESFRRWWGPNGYSCPVCKIDLRVGGKYFASMKNNNEEMYGTGTYREIVPQSRLVMTDSFADSEGNIIPPPKIMVGEWADELIVTVELEEKNGHTHMSFKHEGVPTEQYEGCITGWQQSFNKMESHLKE